MNERIFYYRRRKRFVPNAYGSKHEEATLRTEPITEEEEEKLRKIASGSDLIGYEMKF